MASIRVREGRLLVELSLLERLGAFHRGEVSAPTDAVTDVRVAPDGWKELRGIRAPGTGWPGLIMLGTLRHAGTRTFCAVYRHGPAVVVDLAAGEFRRWVVSSDRADSLAAALQAARR